MVDKAKLLVVPAEEALDDGKTFAEAVTYLVAVLGCRVELRATQMTLQVHQNMVELFRPAGIECLWLPPAGLHRYDRLVFGRKSDLAIGVPGVAP